MQKNRKNGKIRNSRKYFNLKSPELLESIRSKEIPAQQIDTPRIQPREVERSH